MCAGGRGGWGWGCIRVGAWVVYSRSKPKNLILNSNNVRIDEFIDPGLQQFTGQTTHKNGERNIQNTELFPWASLDLLKKQTCLGKKNSTGFTYRFLSSRYKYNCTVHI